MTALSTDEGAKAAPLPRGGGAERASLSTIRRFVLCTLPDDYHKRWLALARYGLARKHGPACKLSLMYALTLRRAAAADIAQVRRLAPRIWEAEGSRKHRSERIALLDDELVEALLAAVQETKCLPTPTFPIAPCGSDRADVWCHSFASRKQFRGQSNFEALSKQFELGVGEHWAPNEIYMVSVAVFRRKFRFEPSSACCILATQLGLKTLKNALYVSQMYACGSEDEEGRIELHEGRLWYHCPN